MQEDSNRLEMKGSYAEDTIVAISTSLGEAGIGIVRLSGSDAFSITDALFRPKNHQSFSPALNRKLRYGWIEQEGEVVDEVLVSYMKGPHTYTAEDVTEINAHGGAISVQRILALALAHGARLAEAGEFTRRAFLNGRLDLTQAEAVLDIIDAGTEMAQKQAVQQLTGALSSSIGALKEDLLHLLSHVEYAINFMEDAEYDLPVGPMQEEADALLERMASLLETARNGRLVREGIATAIVGRPNVGKSSLLNALLHQERAIVTDIPGTTRDAIEERVQLDGVALRLIDTAGIRKTDDVVESIGVGISRRHLEEADLVLVMLDGSREPSEEDEEILASVSEKTALVLLNKEDVLQNAAWEAVRDKWRKEVPSLPWLSISAREETGLEALKRQIITMMFGTEPKATGAVLTNVRQLDLLRKAEEALREAREAMEAGIALDALDVDLHTAYAHLADITGEGIEEDVLNKIFQDFCVGK